MRDNHYRDSTNQAVSYDASVACTNPFGAQTRAVRLVATTLCHVVFGASPTATTSEALLPANTDRICTVSPGQKVAAIKASGGSAGVLTVTELTQ